MQHTNIYFTAVIAEIVIPMRLQKLAPAAETTMGDARGPATHPPKLL